MHGVDFTQYHTVSSNTLFENKTRAHVFSKLLLKNFSVTPHGIAQRRVRKLHFPKNQIDKHNDESDSALTNTRLSQTLR